MHSVFKVIFSRSSPLDFHVISSEKIEPFIFAGVDDATKCPCIGSIFIAGVTADIPVIDFWESIGVKDSKVIAPKKREILAEIIKNTAKKFVIKEITPEMIDDKIFNLNEWEMIIVVSILNELMKTENVKLAYIDNWEVTNKRFVERLESFREDDSKTKFREKNIKISFDDLENILLIPGHKADEKYTVVGAASILAKASSDAQYRRYKKIYGDFGSGSPGDPKTRKFVWENKHNFLPIIRKSWLTYRVIINLDNIEDDFIVSRRKSKRSINF